jgi:hypothetical protein
LTLGTYSNFPLNIHYIDNFKSAVSTRQLQQRLIRVLYELNQKEFSFEEVANPTIPKGRVIFECGLAEADGFNFIDDAELDKALTGVGAARLAVLDFFCSIRYYRVVGDKKSALKFDYYLLRTLFGKESFGVQVSHERGPRYLSPQDLVNFIISCINGSSKRKILKPTSIQDSI